MLTSKPTLTGQTKLATRAAQALHLVRVALLLSALYLVLASRRLSYTLGLSAAVTILVVVTVGSHVAQRRPHGRPEISREHWGRSFWLPTTLDVLAVAAVSVAVLAPRQVVGSLGTAILLAAAVISAAAGGWLAARP